MEFYKSRVYTAVNADELKVGSKCIFADTVKALRKKVQADDYAQYVQPFIRLHDNGYDVQFLADCYTYAYAYLIEPPSEEKYQMFTRAKKAWQTIKDHGGWVSTCGDRYLITAISAIIGVREPEEICIAGKWQSTEYLFNNFVFADDGSPCGELREE